MSRQSNFQFSNLPNGPNRPNNPSVNQQGQQLPQQDQQQRQVDQNQPITGGVWPQRIVNQPSYYQETDDRSIQQRDWQTQGGQNQSRTGGVLFDGPSYRSEF